MADAPFVYLDWAATAPLSLEAARAMAPYLEAGTAGLVQGSGNANALHTAAVSYTHLTLPTTPYV